ncbi:Ketosteroid isomerase-related protein [Reichenbachiella agariperforans]|uniref:Ketosteroid isomerase-related protein n=1 Tax=Reichenbachiella agariperforans TaxID=156994 RepID=A0A1M6M4B5_REIAG|nr:nuclear transport factor 2 family protein [Reichenbachiella agariperforans]SHJ78281.1 Ketosteroid isomerase-related protein [Reichenbachiella agariperforans]
MSHIGLIEHFYKAFSQKDAHAMKECYHPDLRFEDPVFGVLNYQEACAMWEMLIKAGSDLEIFFDNVIAEGEHGSVDWGANYSFSKTGRKVSNKIHASFVFKDGLIVAHTDRFDLYRWARMAFGSLGYTVGWTPFFQNKLRATARKNLDTFMRKEKA